MNEDMMENGGEEREQIARDVCCIREELSTIRQLMEESHLPVDTSTGAIERAVQEYCQLPSDDENPIRWGFIGAWNGGHAYSIETTSMDAFLDSTPNEEVAAFAAIFTNPNTVEICKYLFRSGGKANREALRQTCNLDEEELDSALKPLLQWRFVEWKGEQLEVIYHGSNFALTLIEMAAEAVKQKTDKWD